MNQGRHIHLLRLSIFPALSSLLVCACLLFWSKPACARQGAAAKSAPERAAASKTILRTENSPELGHRDNRYRLCASDVIAVNFPLTPEFDQTVTIQPDGFATLAAVGDVRLEGLTTEGSIQAIRAAYSKMLHAPIVTVELKKFNEPYFIVGGQVRQPGKYDLRGYTSATEAVAMAGGFNHDAKHSQVLLFRRVNDDWFEVTSLNLKRILQGRDLAEDPKIQSGDMLFVPTISGLRERDPAVVPDMYEKSYRLIFYLGFPAFASVVIVSPLVSVVWLGRYEPVFMEFVALLAIGWLVNVLSNPAYVVDLATGALRWVAAGCVLTAFLNAALGAVLGDALGGPAVVIASVSSLIVGYAIILGAYHIENRIPFRTLIPPQNASILAVSAIAIIFFLPLFAAGPVTSLFSPRITFGIPVALLMIVASMWMHPMRRRVWNWVTSRAVA